MFSTKGRILTTTLLAASLVPMVLGQQPPPPRPATAPPTAQSPNGRTTPPQARTAPAALPDTPEASTPDAALAPAIAGEPSRLQTPTAARAPSAPAALLQVEPALAPATRPQYATPRAAVAPAISAEPSSLQTPKPARTPTSQAAPASTHILNPQSAAPVRVTPRTARPARTEPFEAQRVPVAASTPSMLTEPPQQRTPRAPTARPQPAVAQTPSASAPSRSPDYVEEKGFKGRVFEIKHRDPDSLASVLRPLGSGFKGATITANREFKILTVRDFPENIAAMEEAIKRLDTPESTSPVIEFTLHILIASNTEGTGSELPAELASVVKQLQLTLKYKNYGLLTSMIQRTQEGPNPIRSNGVAESRLLGITTPQGSSTFYNFMLGHIAVEGASTASPTVHAGAFNFSIKVPLNLGDGHLTYESIGIDTPVSVRQGEKVVVGTTSMGDKGLIVVLSAKVLK